LLEDSSKAIVSDLFVMLVGMLGELNGRDIWVPFVILLLKFVSFGSSSGEESKGSEAHWNFLEHN